MIAPPVISPSRNGACSSDRLPIELRLQSLGQRHDDREDHRRAPDDRGADEHRFRGRLERVAGAVVLLEQRLGLSNFTVRPKSFFSSW
jgi:hypothetical protein